MSSIRGKIMFGYYAMVAGMTTLALFAYGDMHFLERRIVEGTAVSDFQEQALEMRRHEKNFFLYHDRIDLDKAEELALALAGELDSRRAFFGNLAPADDLDSMRRNLQAYSTLIRQYLSPAAGDSVRAAALEHDIRAAGHSVSGEAEAIADRERAMLASTVQQSRHALFLSLGLVALFGAIAGQVLARLVMRPLARLEAKLEPFARGRFHKFTETSGDREIVSFTRALNRMLEELEARQRQVLQSEKLASLGTLAAGVAHEINNPLGNISSSCQILLEELEEMDQETLRGWLAQIDGETVRAQHIVTALLEYSRKRAYHTGPVVLRDVIGKCLLLMRRQLPGRDTVEVEVSPAISIAADPQRMQQVFINLIKNALDAGGAAVRIRITARPMAEGSWPPSPDSLVVGKPEHCPQEDRDGVLITVADDGPGIPPEWRTKVFDPFFTTRDTGHGTGLGLYIVAEIVQEQGGCIALDCPPEGGARFTIRLPSGESQP